MGKRKKKKNKNTINHTILLDLHLIVTVMSLSFHSIDGSIPIHIYEHIYTHLRTCMYMYMNSVNVFLKKKMERGGHVRHQVTFALFRI